MTLKNTILTLLLVATLIVGVNSPMLFIASLVIVIYLGRPVFIKLTARLSYQKTFLLYGLLFGLLTEFFAILDNLHLLKEERILLHPEPVIDLVFGIFYYGLFIVAWLLLLRRYDFSKKTIFISSGIFGILSEQGGAIVLGIIASPLLGTLLAFLVMSVYGVFPTLAYYLASAKFPERQKPNYPQYLLIPITFFIFWAVYGNIFHKLLLMVFG
ncbi:MAG: hypothetical protein QG653_718 [Patescibacteria group bacterium]|nr:hypothetical protein [Patescibacteria group bacterium]